MARRKILMIPGPSESDPRVLPVMAQPILPHYGPEFGRIYEETCNLMKKIFETKQSVILLSGPGSAALEMAVINAMKPGGKVLVTHNGWFGEVFKQIVEYYGGEPILVKEEPGKPIDPEKVREKISEVGGVDAVTVVHNETSTGVVNPVKEIGEVAREFDAIYIVDVVSSFGGMEVKADEWHVDVCIGYPSKCLGGVNGVVPVMISDRMWELVERRREPIRSRVLNLKVWKWAIEEWGPWGHPFPTSMPTATVLALKRAAELAIEEGLENRYRRHRVASKAFREGIRALGLKTLADEEHASPTVTAVMFPEGIDADKVRKIMYDEHDIMVASTGAFIGVKGLRVGHMGVTASREYIIPTLMALEMAMSKAGAKVELGSGVRAALEVFSSA